MPSYRNSLLSQMVLLVAVSIIGMQIYWFIKTGSILELFNSLASMVFWAYFQRANTSLVTSKSNESTTVQDTTEG